MGDQCSIENKKRVTFKRTHENRNIKTLLKDLYAQIGKNHKTSKKIELALVSLSKYPVQITSGEGCSILQGFDKNLCRLVDEQLFKKTEMAFVEDNASTVNIGNYKDIEMATTLEQTNLKDSRSKIKKDSNQNNKLKNCKFNNEAEALLIALHQQKLEHPCRPALKKKELLLKVQKSCTQTIDWNFVKLLEQKHKLINFEQQDGVELYSLTDLGTKVVENNLKEYRVSPKDDEVHNDLKNNRLPSCSAQVTLSPLSSLNCVNNHIILSIDMPPGSYDIIMLVDKNEPKMLSDQGKNLKSESRSLKVGDVIWVARSKINSQELVLPYILERKRMDDFAASIKDGRFHEQKFRLRKCGLRNVIYLLEDHQGNKHCGLSMSTLNQASANTRVQDGFLVQHTDSIRDTKIFLDMMTARLASELEGVHLRGSNTDAGGRELMTFEYFNASASKTKPLTIKELFIKMLLQLKGVSVEKALAITKAYNSPMALMKAYDGRDSKEAELLLANLKFNNVTPRVSPALSKVVYMLFNKMY